MKPNVRVRGEFEDSEFIRGKKSKFNINKDLCERVDYIVGDELLRDEDFRYEQEELADLTEAYRIAMNMDKKQLAVFLCACIDKYPYLVYQGLAENHETLSKKRRDR